MEVHRRHIHRNRTPKFQKCGNAYRLLVKLRSDAVNTNGESPMTVVDNRLAVYQSTAIRSCGLSEG